MPYYTPRAIEPKWQQFWESHKTFSCPDPNDASVKGKPKVYILDMFPYPSGSGLHVGHPEGYTATDILSRFKRMNGFHVLHPMGWDAFGLPAEQHAIATGEHPRINTQNNINTFRRQIKSLGFSYDWDREVDTTDPDYCEVDAVDLPRPVRHLVRPRRQQGPANQRTADPERHTSPGGRCRSPATRTQSGWPIKRKCR